MALKPPRVPRVDDGSSEPARPAQPIRPIWQGALIWVVGIIVVLLAVGAAARYLLLPALSGNSSTQSAAEAHLSALQTQEALTPQLTVGPTPATTPAPAAVARPTVAPTTPPTAVQSTATPASFCCSSKGMPKLRCTLKPLLRNRLYLLNRGGSRRKSTRGSQRRVSLFFDNLKENKVP